MKKDRPEQGEVGLDGNENLPPEIVGFLDSVVGNHLLRYDVLQFYHRNPYAILTAPDLTVWVSLQGKPLAETRQSLAEMRYLTRSRASAAFVLTTDSEKRREIGSVLRLPAGKPRGGPTNPDPAAPPSGG